MRASRVDGEATGFSIVSIKKPLLVKQRPHSEYKDRDFSRKEKTNPDNLSTYPQKHPNLRTNPPKTSFHPQNSPILRINQPKTSFCPQN
jgi:hypothetical protein